MKDKIVFTKSGEGKVTYIKPIEVTVDLAEEQVQIDSLQRAVDECDKQIAALNEKKSGYQRDLTERQTLVTSVKLQIPEFATVEVKAEAESIIS